MSSAESRPYHIHQRGENLGQMTREDILAQLASGRLQPNALYWQPGMTEWRPLSTMSAPEDPAPQPEDQPPIFPDAPTAQEPIFPSAPEPVFPSSPAAPDPALISQTPAQPAAPRQGPPPLPPRQPRAAGTPPPLPPRPTQPASPHPQPAAAPQPAPKPRPPAQPGKKNSHWHLYAAAAAILLLIGFALWYWVDTKPERLYQKAQVARSSASPKEVVRLLQQSADLGHPQAMVELATCHRFGTGTPRDLPRAYQLYYKAAQLGNPTGQLQTGLCLAAGIGSIIDSPQAIQWLERATESGHPDGPYHVAAYYYDQANPDLHKKGVTLLEKASTQGHLTAQGHYHWHLHQQQPTLDTLRALMKAAEAGDALSQYFYAQTFRDPRGRITDPSAYQAWLEKAAAQHLPRALIALGQLQESDQVSAKALDYYNQALQLGSLEAHLHIGRLQFLSQSSPETQRTALEHYLTAAESHLPEAQYQLGTLYQSSPLIPQDLKQAKKWYEAAADGGSAAAKNALGYMFENGNGIPEDRNLAYLYFKSAAAQDDAQGCYELFRLQLEGTTKDLPAALKNLQKSAQKNYRDALYTLGMAYQDALYGLPKDPTQARENLEKAAELGLPKAQYIIASWYAHGVNYPQDAAKSREWLQKAADQDYGFALHQLALSYKKSSLFPPDPAKYQTYLRRAAAQKNPLALRDLAFAIFNREEGIQGTDEEATALMEESARLNDPKACYFIGIANIRSALEQNFPLAIEWLTKAAEQGHLSAQIDLADIYTHGSKAFKKESPTPPGFPKKAFQNPDNDIPPDPQKAFHWRRLAAQQGDSESQGKLGQAYMFGQGTDLNLPEAILWLQKAAEQKEPQAHFFLGVAQLENKQPQESTETFRQGAELGDPECQYQYAGALYEGKDNPADLKKAYTWMEKSAHQGYIKAILTLYDWNFTGTGTPKSTAKANQWLDLAAAAGVASAQTRLAADLISGEQQRKTNFPAAHDLLQKATAQNHPRALYILGVCYEYGMGVSIDMTRALEYYQKAAERGNSSGQYQIGVNLLALAKEKSKKDGVALLTLAYGWFKLASTGHEKAPEALAGLSKQLTPEQITQAEQTVTDFTPIDDETKPPAFLPEGLKIPQ